MIDRKSNLPDLLIALGSSMLCSWGLIMFSTDLVGLFTGFSPVFSLTAVIIATAILLSMYIKPKILLATIGVITVPLLLLLIFTDLFEWLRSTISKFLIWLPAFLGANASRQRNFETALYVLLVCIISILCFLCFVVIRNMLLSFAVVILPVLILHVFVRKDLPLLWLIPAALGLFVMMMLTAQSVVLSKSAKEKSRKGFFQSFPVVFIPVCIGLIVVILFSINVPSASLRRQDVADITDDTLSFLNIPLPDASGRKTFNLGGIGFYPMHDQLGGPVVISNEEVMRVRSSDDLLIRAITYNIYSNTYWSSNSYMFSTRFDSKPLLAARYDFFDTDRPRQDLIPEDLYNAIFEESSVHITNSTNKVGGTLFTPDHMINLLMPEKEVFYNQAGEVYLRDGVDVGQSYDVIFNRFRTSSKTYEADLLRLEAYVTEHPEAKDSEAKILEIRENNLNVENVPDSVKDYATALVTDAMTPLERALAIQDDLLTNFTYSLDVEVPPKDMDFVEHFLQTKKGYCTYFASAMTMMARACDVPARYVEGFVVSVPLGLSEATVIVSGRHAHAWCEIYIDGIGWIPIDATAGSSEQGLSFSQELGGMASSAYDIFSDTSEGKPEDHIPYIDQGENVDTPALPSNTTERADNTVIIVSYVLLGILLTGISTSLLLAWLRWKRSFSFKDYEREYNTRHLASMLTWIWKRSLSYLSLLSVTMYAAETPIDFAGRIQDLPIYAFGVHKDTYSFDLMQIAQAYERYIYGGKIPTAEKIEAAHRCCLKLAADVLAAHRSKFFLLLRLIVHSCRRNT